jgi:protein involved in ribonucleotide reduction
MEHSEIILILMTSYKLCHERTSQLFCSGRMKYLGNSFLKASQRIRLRLQVHLVIGFEHLGIALDIQHLQGVMTSGPRVFT